MSIFQGVCLIPHRNAPERSNVNKNDTFQIKPNAGGFEDHDRSAKGAISITRTSYIASTMPKKGGKTMNCWKYYCRESMSAILYSIYSVYLYLDLGYWDVHGT